jgi:hypothetical protein
MITMVDERLNLRLEVYREEVIFQQDAVLQSFMPSLNLALCLRMIQCPSDVPHFLLTQPFGQFARDVAGPVIRQQSRLMNNASLIAT